ncbi:MAG: hypothetical protein HUK20_10485 [Fibrobacter sp.]|nr:hypothetical protein [Fibrobacter sp.]
MNKNIFSFSIVFSALILSACFDNGTSADDASFNASKVCPADGNNAYGDPNRGTFTDIRDGQVYKYTTIGNQVWMAQNLSYDNGAPCAEEPCSVKGREYMFNQMQDACPAGWHIPNKEEWETLLDNMGGIDSAGYRLKSTSGWIPLNPGQVSNGTDDCGFLLLPIPTSGTGANHFYSKLFDGYVALFWTGHPIDEDNRSTLGVLFETQNTNAFITRYYHDDYLSIRCVKD